MRDTFYDSDEYRKKQSAITKRNTELGLYEHLKKQVTRVCARESCIESFVTHQADPKRFCGRSCSASASNTGRKRSLATRSKISKSLTGRPTFTENGIPRRGSILVPRVEKVCANHYCKSLFTFERYKNRLFCSTSCAIKTIGSRPTSAKASRGKSGIRPDIDGESNFHSRWEANIARWYTFLRVEWVYEPKSFDIGNQMYTPDFYLPEFDMYVEVKNFWSEYSSTRDLKFRNTFPDLRLEVILKKEYLEIQEQFCEYIPYWEYNNGPLPVLSLEPTSSSLS
jgi:hypothetical protein